MAKIKGYWTLNESIDVLSKTIGWEAVTFSDSDFSTYNSICVDTSEENLKYDYSAEGGSDYQTAYSQSNGWTIEYYRNLDFGETEQTISEKLAQWLIDNGTSNGGTITLDEEEAGIIITYGDEVLAILKAGQTATLHCKNKIMKHDIIISASTFDGSVDVEEEVKIGTFTMYDTSYNFEIGMTWAEFIESDYNTDDYFCSSTDNLYLSYGEGSRFLARVTDTSGGYEVCSLSGLIIDGSEITDP